jgi:hypothetical protein
MEWAFVKHFEQLNDLGHIRLPEFFNLLSFGNGWRKRGTVFN